MPMEDWFLARARVSSKPHKRVTLDDKMTFFQQLATLVSSGTPLLQALNTASQQSQSTRLREILEDMARRVSAGESLHAAMADYRGVFEDHWIELVGVGEVSGKMASVLQDLNQQIQDGCSTRRKVVGAMGGVMHFHMRDYRRFLLEAIREAIRVGEEGRVPVNLSHMYPGGKRFWGEMAHQATALAAEARTRGVEVTFDVTPWTSVVDALGLIEETLPPSGTEWAYGAHLGFEDLGPDGSFVPGQAYRCFPDDTWTIGVFDLGVTDTPGVENQPCVTPCPEDINGDGTVDVADLLDLLAAWGATSGPADINGDGIVDVADLLLLLAAWGPCP